MLPAEIKLQRPGLLLAQAWITVFQQQFEELTPLIARLESLLDEHKAEPQYIQGFNFFHGLIHYWQGNSESSLRFLEKEIEQVPERPGISDGAIGLYFGLALCMNGQKAKVIRTFKDLMAGVQRPELYRSQLIGALAFVHLVSGDLTQAAGDTRRLAHLTSKRCIANSEAWSDCLLACTHFHANALDAALYHFSNAARQRYILEPKGTIDALAGKALTQALFGSRDRGR